MNSSSVAVLPGYCGIGAFLIEDPGYPSTGGGAGQYSPEDWPKGLLRLDAKTDCMGSTILAMKSANFIGLEEGSRDRR